MLVEVNSGIPTNDYKVELHMALSRSEKQSIIKEWVYDGKVSIKTICFGDEVGDEDSDMLWDSVKLYRTRFSSLKISAFTSTVFKPGNISILMTDVIQMKVISALCFVPHKYTTKICFLELKLMCSNNSVNFHI